MGLIHHCKAAHQQGDVLQKPGEYFSILCQGIQRQTNSVFSWRGAGEQAVPLSFPGVFPVGIQHPSPSKIQTENRSYLAGSLDLEEVDRG